MPVVKVPLSAETLAITSTVSGVFAFGMACFAGLKPVWAAGIALAVGGFLYITGIVPIGALIALGLATLGMFFRR